MAVKATVSKAVSTGVSTTVIRERLVLVLSMVDEEFLQRSRVPCLRGALGFRKAPHHIGIQDAM